MSTALKPGPIDSVLQPWVNFGQVLVDKLRTMLSTCNVGSAMKASHCLQILAQQVPCSRTGLRRILSNASKLLRTNALNLLSQNLLERATVSQAM